RVGYYVDLDLAVWGRQTIGEEFAAYAAAHHEPLDLVIDLANRSGSVLLNGSGFDGPPWSVRLSMANLDAADYEAIGRDLKALARQAGVGWGSARKGWRMAGVFHFLQAQPFIAIFLVVAAGMWLGAKSVAGISLGSVV